MPLFLELSVQESIKSYLLSAFRVSDTVLGTENSAENNSHAPVLKEQMNNEAKSVC